MVRKHAFDVYIPLAQDELDLPLFETIQNLNWLIGNALKFDSSRIAIFMEKYDMMFKQFPEVHAIDGSGNPTNETSIGDANHIGRFFDVLFGEMESYPIMQSPFALITNQTPPDFVVQTWNTITTCQILLPCVVNLKQHLERRFGRKMQSSIIICSIDEYLKKRNPVGYAFINRVIDDVFNANRKPSWDSLQSSAFRADVGADVFLNGLTRLSLMSTHYLNMCDVGSIVGNVVASHALLKPDVLPPTALY